MVQLALVRMFLQKIFSTILFVLFMLGLSSGYSVGYVVENSNTQEQFTASSKDKIIVKMLTSIVLEKVKQNPNKLSTYIGLFQMIQYKYKDKKPRISYICGEILVKLGIAKQAEKVEKVEEYGKDVENESKNIQNVSDVQSKLDIVRNDILKIVNNERSKLGLGKLKLNDKLNITAQKHIEYMAKTEDFSHTTKVGSTPRDRTKEAGYNYSAAAENIAMGQKNSETVMNSRMNSPGHKSNILNKSVDEIGIGYSGSYRVQVFGKER